MKRKVIRNEQTAGGKDTVKKTKKKRKKSRELKKKKVQGTIANRRQLWYFTAPRTSGYVHAFFLISCGRV